MLRELMLAIALAITTPTVVHAQGNVTPDQIVDTFFGNLKSGDAAKAYKDLWQGTLMDKKQADVGFVASQTNIMLQTFGKVDGWEMMSDESRSPSFKERRYLLKLEGGPLFFRMQFYRGSKGWFVYRLDLNDQLDKLP